MERNWIYKDDLGSEYGPYSREELERYAREGRVSHKGLIKNPEGDWSSPEEAGLELPEDKAAFGGAASKPGDPNRLHPTTDSDDAVREFQSNISYSPHQRTLYIVLGIALPLVTGIAGVNNLIVGRTGVGLTQLALSLGALLMALIGVVLIFPICLAIPMALGAAIWSIIEAVINTEDGEGRLMR
jgi:hypothetical protein